MLQQSGARLLLQQSGARLLQASELGDIGLAQACLDEGARANHADAVGHTSLHKCAFMGFNEMALLLLRHDHTLVNVQDMSSSTPLHVAAWAGNQHLAALLLEHRADANAADLSGNTPLHRATLEGHEEVMRVLLANGASALSLGTEGSSALHFAALSAPVGDGELRLAELLLAYGADPQVTNRHGNTASSLAEHQGRQRLAQRLKEGVSGATGSVISSLNASAASQLASADEFTFVLGCLQSAGLRRVTEAFHSSHHYKFRTNYGGDYPLELTALHTQFTSLASRHLERLLATRGLSWEVAAAACQRAAHDGRCTVRRLALLQQLAALQDFGAFFSLMSCAALPELEIDEHDVAGEEGTDCVEEEEDTESRAGRATSATQSATPEAAAWLDTELSAYGCAGATLSCEFDEPHINSSEVPSALPSNFPSLSATQLIDPRDATAQSAHSAGAGSDAGRSSDSGHSGLSRISGLTGAGTVESGASSALLNPFARQPVLLRGVLRLPVEAGRGGGGADNANGEEDSRGTDSEGEEVEGQWRRGKRIGLGSSGEVFLVQDESRALSFAAKLVVPRDEEAAARLDAEIALMRRLDHPNIVCTLGTATSDEWSSGFSGGGTLGGGDRYLLMELCRGGSVRQLLNRDHPSGLPPELHRRYARQLLSGLHFLHEKLIIHRDLKGENLLFLDESRQVVKIADFGSSDELLAGRTLTQNVGAIRGSPYWMSPEHIQGERCGRKADIWSFACVLLEMATGLPPWADPSASNNGTGGGQFAVFQLLDRIVRAPGPPPMPENMDASLREMLLDCFCRDHAARPTTAELFNYRFWRVA